MMEVGKRGYFGWATMCRLPSQLRFVASVVLGDHLIDSSQSGAKEERDVMYSDLSLFYIVL